MRTYSEREVASIIERAVERQAETDQMEGAPGLTLDEIERLGQDAGIDPAHLRAAAQEVGAHGRTFSGTSGMTRTHVHVERWVDGPLIDEAWEDTVAHLRQHFGTEMSAVMGMGGNQVQQIGQAHEWTHTSSLGVQTRVTVSPRGDRTRLRITQLVGLSSTRVEGLGYGSLIALVGALIGGGLGSSILDGPVGAITGMVVAFILTLAVAAPIVTRLDEKWRAKKLRQLGDLADELAPMLATEAPPHSESTATSGEPKVGASQRAPQLDLETLDDAPESETSGDTRSRIR
ncbi:MAG: hypothetical protein Rubg2KO_22530 [Rubricoccaceae bacterium]